MMSFRNSLLKTDWPTAKPVYNIHNPTGLKLLTMLRLGLSHLNEHKFNRNFRYCMNPLFPCSFEVELVPIFFCTAIMTYMSKKPFFMNYNQFMRLF